jgi:hypothetical protein
MIDTETVYTQSEVNKLLHALEDAGMISLCDALPYTMQPLRIKLYGAALCEQLRDANVTVRSNAQRLAASNIDNLDSGNDDHQL